MKGFLFISDAVFAALIFVLTIILVVHGISTTVDALSFTATKTSLRKTAEHVVNVLLYANNPEFRCQYGTNRIPVPLCVWDNGGDANDFWTDRKLGCAVETPDRQVTRKLAEMLGCERTLPSEYNNLLRVEFTLCWADTLTDDGVQNCDFLDVNLYLWN